MARNQRHAAAESDPLLPSADLTTEVTATTSTSTTDPDADTRTTAQRLRIAIPCLLCFFCLIIGDALTTTPVLQIRENLICRRLFPDASLDLDPRCKSNPVQAELALVNGWELTFIMLPSILTGVPWGIAADAHGRTRILQLANLGVLLSLGWQVLVYTVPDALPVRLVWLQGVFFLLGGGASTYGALLYTIATDISSDAHRATAILALGTATHAASLLAGPVTYLAMQRGAWFALWLGIAVWLLVFVLTALIPETRSDAAVRRAGEDEALREERDDDDDDAGAMKRAWWDVRPLVSSTVAQTKMVINVIVLQNATLGLLLFSTVFTSSRPWARRATRCSSSSIKGIVSIVLTAALLPAISQVLLAKLKLAPIIKDWWLTIGSLCVVIVGSACLAAAGSSALFIVSLVVLQLGSGYEFAFRSMASEMVDPDHIAMLFTAYSVFMLMSEVGAGPILALVFNKGLAVGGKWMALPFFVATILFCITLIITCSVRLNKHPKAQKTSH